MILPSVVYTDVFEPQIQATIGLEGGYTDQPGDAGGPTMWGITEHDARQFGYTGAMQDLPRPTAVVIYRRKYVQAPQFDALAAIDQRLAFHMFDAGVNCGPARPSTWAQMALNALNLGGTRWPDIAEDGVFGEHSRAAVESLYAQRGPKTGGKVLLGMVLAQQSVFYMDIARKNPSQEMFVWGWESARAFGDVSLAVPDSD